MKLRIKEFRESSGYTQTELGKLIGRSIGTIQAWECGRAYPNAVDICQLCEVLHTDPNTILGWYDDHPGKVPPPKYIDKRQARMNEAYESVSDETKDAIAASAIAVAQVENARVASQLKDDMTA